MADWTKMPCLPTPYKLDRDGYGRRRYNGKSALTHRVAWEQNFGPIPKGKQVLHRCDNPPCVEPTHLFLGTHRDNMTDMEQKGRAAFGEKHGQHKLSTEQVEEIRSRYAKGGVTQRELSEEFGVRELHIWRILTGRTRVKA